MCASENVARSGGDYETDIDVCLFVVYLCFVEYEVGEECYGVLMYISQRSLVCSFEISREFILVIKCGCSDPPHLAVMCLVSPW